MIWLKHMILTLAVAVMTAGPALSCCMPNHSDMSAMSEASHDAAPSHHKMESASKTGHPCDEPASTPTNSHSTDTEHGMCEGCADCSFMTTQAKAHFSIVQIKIDFEVEQLVQTLTSAVNVQPPALAKFIKPPATAPPLLLSPVRLKQILIV